MYSGTTFRTKSGKVMGVHQKIDRLARRQLAKVADLQKFPTSQEIIHFEGLNGPDGIKRKSPARDEPWHYIDPDNPQKGELLGLVDAHIHNLAKAISSDNQKRAAFESAWLAHAIVDGLTPAHHYPLEDKLEQLRGGEALDTRVTAKDKLVLPGKTRLEQILNNWEYWGAKGVMTTHLGFELGVATSIATLKFEQQLIGRADLMLLADQGYQAVFLDTLNEVHKLDMFHQFSRRGWTRRLAQQTRTALLPLITKAVALAWHQALVDAEDNK